MLLPQHIYPLISRLQACITFQNTQQLLQVTYNKTSPQKSSDTQIRSILFILFYFILCIYLFIDNDELRRKMVANNAISTDLSKTNSSFTFIYLINFRFKLSDIVIEYFHLVDCDVTASFYILYERPPLHIPELNESALFNLH